MSQEERYKEKISEYLGCHPDSLFLYWKGRIALFAILKAIGVKDGDEVVIPGFTCVVVPNAIIYAGGKPVYVDISPDDYNTDISKLENAISPRTKAIVCQNTFGLSSNIEQILEIAQKYGLYTIEDCTHGFGGFYNGKPNGVHCDAAFFSTQWNKPFSTGIGGILLVNKGELVKKISKTEETKIRPALFERMILSSLIFFRKYFVNNFTQEKLVSFFRFLSKHNLIIGSNQGNELKNVLMPDNYFKDISSVQVKKGIQQLKRLPRLNELRKKNAKEYTQYLKANKKNHVDEKYFDNHLFLKYPLLVRDRKLFFELAQKSGIVLGDWFLSPLHPIETDLDAWDFNEDCCPVASYISKHIINLPTDIKNNRKVLTFLSENLDEII